MSKYDKLKAYNEEKRDEEERNIDYVIKSFDEIKKDVERVTDIYENADIYLEDIDEKFKKITKLNDIDVSVLLLGTALQIARWIVLGEISGALSDKINENRVNHDDKEMQKKIEEKEKKYSKKHESDKAGEHRNFKSILFDSVPYDIIEGSKKFGINLKSEEVVLRKDVVDFLDSGEFKKISMCGTNHRYHTLGHDPILGWIFGTANILSDTITLDKSYMLKSFEVCMEKGKKKEWTNTSTMANVFGEAKGSVEEDKKRLGAALFKQAVHFESDEYTKMGLPIPILPEICPEFAEKLYKENYDFIIARKDFLIGGAQAILAILINEAIKFIHKLYYKEDEYPSEEIYEVKTRKILSWSNLIASSSNVIAVALMEASNNVELKKKGIQYIDVGGYMVTIYRLISDTKFIRKVKKEFLEKEWETLVLGEEYSFMSLEEIKNE